MPRVCHQWVLYEPITTGISTTSRLSASPPSVGSVRQWVSLQSCHQGCPRYSTGMFAMGSSQAGHHTLYNPFHLSHRRATVIRHLLQAGYKAFRDSSDSICSRLAMSLSAVTSLDKEAAVPRFRQDLCSFSKISRPSSVI
jgi:hypothetical protein